MNLHNNTIFITGGGSGIGKGLAEAFHRLGNQVIIAGRRQEKLEQTCSENPGMRYFRLDVADPAAISKVAAQVLSEFPALNCVCNNAGVQHFPDFAAEAPVDDAAIEEEVVINVLGLIRVSAAFLPHLKKKQDATLVQVSSGLAFVPLSKCPVYCATKAAVHSFTQSLRSQLRGGSVRVVELIPPWVGTELGGPDKPRNPHAAPMPLDEFTTEAVRELGTDAEEIVIGPARFSYSAVSTGAAREIFARMNG